MNDLLVGLGAVCVLAGCYLILPALALIMGVDRAVRQMDYSKYEEEGLFVL